MAVPSIEGIDYFAETLPVIAEVPLTPHVAIADAKGGSSSEKGKVSTTVAVVAALVTPINSLAAMDVLSPLVDADKGSFALAKTYAEVLSANRFAVLSSDEKEEEGQLNNIDNTVYRPPCLPSPREIRDKVLKA